MKLALEALEGLEALLLSMGLTHLIVYGDAEKAITNLQEALAEQPAQQEPVARYKEKCADGSRCLHGCLSGEACHTSPPAQRKPLTDAEIEQVFKEHAGYGGDDFISFARAIEAAHGIKENT